MYNNYSYSGGYMIPQPQYSPSNGLKGRPVSSIEEARAAQIDFDGSLFIFPDIANKRIYTKQINLDGTASLKIYTQIESAPPAPAYITKEELDSAIEALRQSFINVKEQRNESKPKSSNNNVPLTF